MIAEIEGFDETDLKTLQCHLNGKVMKDRLIDFKQIIPGMLARLGVITGIEIPANLAVFQILVTEISNTILNEKKYSNLTFEEYIHAFNMTANNDFIGINDWGRSMNIKYFRQMINAYLLYKGSLMVKYYDWELVATERMKISYQHPGKHKIDYRPVTERCYQEYLTGKFNPYLWHQQCYDDLVDVGWVPADAWKDFEKKAKKILIGELNRDIMAKEKTINPQDRYQKSFRSKYSRLDVLPKTIGAHMQSVSDLTRLHNGELVEPIQARAKQLCMVEYFKQQGIKGTKNLFVPND